MDLFSLTSFVLNALSRPRTATQRLSDILIKDGISYLIVRTLNSTHKATSFLNRRINCIYFIHLQVSSSEHLHPLLSSMPDSHEALKLATVIVIANAPVMISLH